jgi:hypothetical protein
MPWYMAKMFHDSACANLMGRLGGTCGNFQYFTERADCVSSHLGGRIRTRVSHHDDPQRVTPTGIVVSRKYTQNTLGDSVGLIPCRYDDPNRLDSRRCMTYLVIREGACRSDGLKHDSRIASPV